MYFHIWHYLHSLTFSGSLSKLIMGKVIFSLQEKKAVSAQESQSNVSVLERASCNVELTAFVSGYYYSNHLFSPHLCLYACLFRTYPELTFLTILCPSNSFCKLMPILFSGNAFMTQSLTTNLSYLSTPHSIKLNIF